MSILSVYQENAPKQPIKVLTHTEDIAATLAEVGVQFERCEAVAPVAADTSAEEVIAAYRPRIDRLKGERGYVAVDVLSVTRHHPQKAELRARFLEEHRQPGDEARLFVAGRGLLSLHINDLIYAVLCEKHDLISVPAGTRHWFDMGEEPHFTAIRLFSNADGWTAEYTGDDIARRFPCLEDW